MDVRILSVLTPSKHRQIMLRVACGKRANEVHCSRIVLLVVARRLPAQVLSNAFCRTQTSYLFHLHCSYLFVHLHPSHQLLVVWVVVVDRRGWCVATLTEIAQYRRSIAFVVVLDYVERRILGIRLDAM